MSNNIVAVDLFCGIGGLSYGLKMAGISVVAGLDIDKSCKYAFEENVKGEFIAKDISELSGVNLLNNYWTQPGAIKVLVGCAPCQPFSTHSNKYGDRKKSKNWQLLGEFLRIIKETKPSIVSMENVPNLANQKIFTKFIEGLENIGYSVWFSNIYCPDYGVPQKRRRLVLLASIFGSIELLPPTHSSKNYVSVKEAIGNLPEIDAGEICDKDPIHRARGLSTKNILRIKASKPNGTWKDWDERLLLKCHKKESGKTYKSVYGRMSWGEPSPTITTQFYNYGTGRFGHPSQDRAISMREGALLQTFPYDYKFYRDENKISMNRLGKHIGNAVPVKLGSIIGMTIQSHLEKWGINER